MKRQAIYDYLHREALKWITEMNPCGFQNNKCKGPPGGCCSECKHYKSAACTTNSLSCKLWLCNSIQEKYPVLTNILKELEIIAFKNKLYMCRFSRTDIFNQPIPYNLKCEDK